MLTANMFSEKPCPPPRVGSTLLRGPIQLSVHTGNNETNQNQWLKMAKRLVRQSEQPEQRRQMQEHIIRFCSSRAFCFCGPPPQQAAYWKPMLCNSGFWFSGLR